MVFNLLKRPMVKAQPSASAQSSTTDHFRFDAHLLTYAGSQLTGHEYMINITPKEFGDHLARLEEKYEVSVSYEQAGGLADAARAIATIDESSTICSETLNQWRNRDPHAVARLCGEIFEEIDDEDFSLWRI